MRFLVIPAAAQFLVVLSTSIVNVALPSVRADFGADGLPWVVNAYVLTFGALLLAGGRFADRVGGRRAFLGGGVVFGVATLVAGVAPSMPVLLTARAAQGIGAAVLAPAALALLIRLNPGRSGASAVWGAVSAAGGAAGVLLGGVLTSTLGWAAVFWTTVPFVAGLLFAASRVLPADRGTAGPADLPGTLTSTGGLVALVFALSEGGRLGWTHPLVLGGLLAAVVLLLGFARTARRSSAPLVPPRLFRNPATSGMTVVGGIWVGLFFFLPLHQQLLGYHPLTTALSQLPLAGANILASALTPKLVRRFGPAALLTAGLLALSAGLALLSRTEALLGPFLLIGAGLGTAFVQLTAAAVRAVAPGDLGVASGLSNATRQVGGAVGLAALSAVAAGSTGYRPVFLVSAAAAAALVPALAIARRRPTERERTR